MRCPLRKALFTSSWRSPHLRLRAMTKHGTNGDGIYHKTLSLVKVNVQLLVKAFSNNASFILRNRVVGILFDVKHPFIAHYILPWSRRNQSPSTISNESIIFFLHRLNPLRILESLGDCVGFKDSWNYGGEAIFQVGFEDGLFRAGLHGMMV